MKALNIVLGALILLAWLVLTSGLCIWWIGHSGLESQFVPRGTIINEVRFEGVDKEGNAILRPDRTGLAIWALRERIDLLERKLKKKK